MKPKAIHGLFVLLIVFSISCSFITGLVSGGGPKNFTAVLTAPDVVLLTWDAVEGATGYILELSIDKGDSFTIASLPPEVTSYEDLTAPEQGDLTYQVQVIKDSGPAGKSTVSITTGKREPNPLTVTPEYDEKNATTTVIGPQGGTASLIDSNKVEYTLVIPQGALSADTEIRMTAVTSIQDWPLDGDTLGAVRLEPEGLVLNDAAILTIGIPIDVNPDLAIVGYAFDANGQEFHLQPSDEENGLTGILPSTGAHLASLAFQKPKHVIRMPVVELKVKGVGQASGNSVSQYAKDHAPTDSGAALEQKWAAENATDDELAPLENITSEKDPVRAKAFELIKGFYNAENCTEMNSQIASFQIWMNTRSYIGLTDDQRKEYSRQVWDELADKVKEVLEKAATECEKSGEPGGSATTDSPCAKALLEKISTPPQTRSGFWDVLKDKMTKKLSDTELLYMKDQLEKCKTQAYTVEGTWGLSTLTGVIDSLENEFTLESAGGPGCKGEVLFSGGPYGGGVSCSQTCGGLFFTGGGSYTIAITEDGGTITGDCGIYLPASGGRDITNEGPINVTLKRVP
ncbi:MAG: fibronectin type III domain-containing protein [Chloroflexi bacterium]|nr:fibronectin type III domain-containing protein [Chloroflexota bacterium]